MNVRYALNKEGKRICINNTHIKEEYYCPICGEKLVLKKGSIRKHHFSHMANSNCNDGWHYDMSEWHTEWQSKFPEETQEVVKKYNNQKHRADVLIEKCKTVIEFQHSTLSAQEFQARNNFYLSLGYKVIWLFDVSSQYENYGIAELDLSELNTSKTYDMSNMFRYNGFEKLDLSNWDTSNVTDMSEMFYDCQNLISLDVRNFNTSKVVNMSGMFYLCYNLEKQLCTDRF